MNVDFWSRVDKDGPIVSQELGPCWVWKGPWNEKGYGRFHLDRGRRYSHRASWEMHNGPVPVGLNVLHRCDNPPCVRPSHLFLGTQADNMHDMDKKGRRSRAVGEDTSNAKLTESDVIDIRTLKAFGMSTRDLMDGFGVSDECIYNIVKRKRWAHVP